MTSLPPDNPALADTQTFYEDLKRGASRVAKRRNLEILWDVLEEMRRANAHDFSLAEVGRRLEKAGGPKTQSLRNEGGKDFRNLIGAYAAAVGGSSQRIPRGERTQLDIALDAVADPGMRALFKQVVAENRLMKHQNDELRSAFKMLSISAATEHPVATPGEKAGNIQPRPSAGELTPSEIEALRRSIAHDRLAENGWTVQPNGSIIDDIGTTILPPGFAFAVAKIVNGR